MALCQAAGTRTGETEIRAKTGCKKPAKQRRVRLFQNSVSFETISWKIGLKPDFPLKSKEAVPKAEVLEQLR
jgi:hypothetical protein